MKKTFGVTWKPPHGLYEAASIDAVATRNSNTTSAEESQDIVEVDAFLEVPQSQSDWPLSRSQVAEAKRIVREAASMKKQVDAILAEQQPIPNNCKTILEEKVLPQRRVITRPGGSSNNKASVAVSGTPIVASVVQPPAAALAEQPVNTVMEQQPAAAATVVATPVTLPVSTNKRPPKLRTLTKAKAAKVREDIRNLHTIAPHQVQGEAIEPSPTPASVPVPAAAAVVLPTAAQVVEISGKRFSISISGTNVHVTPLDKVDDFRQLVKVGDQIRIVGNSLRVIGVTPFNMYLEPRIKR